MPYWNAEAEVLKRRRINPVPHIEEIELEGTGLIPAKKLVVIQNKRWRG